MKVRATRLGYYDNKRRREGEVFNLIPIKGKKKRGLIVEGEIVLTPEQQFSELWMERVDGEAPAKKVEAKPEPVSEEPAKEEAPSDEDVI